ncbi:MAG: glycosyltransferase family 2 protein [Caldilineaceae bacterium]
MINPWQSTCDLSIIIVSWNVWKLLSACLNSIERHSRPSSLPDSSLRVFGPPDSTCTLEVIVVDNASSDATCDELPTQFPWVRLIRSESNLGFTKGNNLGYQQSRGGCIFFLNPDTELVTLPTPSDSLWLLYSALLESPAVGMVGPQLRYADGSWQNSRRRFPTPLTGFFESTWLGQAWPTNPWLRHMHMSDQPATARHEVDWITGAAMLARREALEEAAEGGVGRQGDGKTRRQEDRETGRVSPDTEPALRHSPQIFDEGFFMYSEELDLCKRVRDAGWRILYIPDTQLIHYEGKSSEQVVAARHIRFNTSKVRYWRKWFGPVWAELLRNYLLLEYRWQLLSEWVKLKLGHRPDLRTARIAAYRQVLQSGLREDQTR